MYDTLKKKLHNTKHNINLFEKTVCWILVFADLLCALAEGDMSVFSLRLGIVSRFVKGQVLQERQYKMQKKYGNPFSFQQNQKDTDRS